MAEVSCCIPKDIKIEDADTKDADKLAEKLDQMALSHMSQQIILSKEMSAHQKKQMTELEGEVKELKKTMKLGDEIRTDADMSGKTKDIEDYKIEAEELEGQIQNLTVEKQSIIKENDNQRNEMLNDYEGRMKL